MLSHDILPGYNSCSFSSRYITRWKILSVTFCSDFIKMLTFCILTCLVNLQKILCSQHACNVVYNKDTYFVIDVVRDKCKSLKWFNNRLQKEGSHSFLPSFIHSGNPWKVMLLWCHNGPWHILRKETMSKNRQFHKNMVCSTFNFTMILFIYI